ncbi:MAG: hypothetical protein WDM96_04170 [Lacunisphaera sp.]
MPFLVGLRCRLTAWLLRQNFDLRYGLANRICPDTADIVAYAARRPVPIPLPACSHIFYHQASVETECAENSLRTLLWNIPETDEVILYDKGGTLPAACFELLARQHWRSWVIHREIDPQMASYTYGMNHSIPIARAPVVMVWRSDYVYPKGLYERYVELIRDHDIVLPYSVFIGGAHVRAGFVREHWDQLENYDTAFWRANAAEEYSIYESQDPVHFAIRATTWARLGGLNHRLWGYGWQFGEFAGRLRRALPRSRIKYFDHAWPVHQNHASSLMVRSEGFDAKKAEEDRVGRERFADFLGGPDLFTCYEYRWHQKLPPIPPEERQ